MDIDLTPLEALTLCVEAAGSQSQMARDLRVSQPAVWKWMQSSKRMPAEYVLRAEQLYRISRTALRPDIYPRDLPSSSTTRWFGKDRAALLGPVAQVAR